MRAQYNLFTTKQLKAEKTANETDYYQVMLQLQPAYRGSCGAYEQHKHCVECCLKGAGNNRFHEGKRKERTDLLLDNRSHFFRLLKVDIMSASIHAEALGKKLLVRLNTLSDYRWESILDPDTGKTIFEIFPEVQFSDYTKWPLSKRIKALEFPNYKLCYSYVQGRDNQAREYLEVGQNVSLVHLGKAPTIFLDVPVVDGDKHDVFFANPGAVVSLKYKTSHGSDGAYTQAKVRAEKPKLVVITD